MRDKKLNQRFEINAVPVFLASFGHNENSKADKYCD
jgi:hypothetical protein